MGQFTVAVYMLLSVVYRNMKCLFVPQIDRTTVFLKCNLNDPIVATSHLGIIYAEQCNMWIHIMQYYEPCWSHEWSRLHCRCPLYDTGRSSLSRPRRCLLSPSCTRFPWTLVTHEQQCFTISEVAVASRSALCSHPAAAYCTAMQPVDITSSH